MNMNQRSSHQNQVSLGGNTRRSSPSTNFADRTTSPVFICERISLPPPVVYLNNTSRSSSSPLYFPQIYIYKEFFLLKFKILTQILKIDLHRMTALLIQTMQITQYTDDDDDDNDITLVKKRGKKKK